MLIVTVAALACLCLARTSPAEPYNLRLYAPKTVNQKDLSVVLASIEERLRVLDVVSAAQAKQERRLDAIQDKLDRVETAVTLKLERAQLAAERLEHRLHMLQTNVQTTIKESSDKLERSQTKLVELAQNLTSQIDLHKRLLEKVNGAYADTWHRGLVLESLMRDGLSLVNVTRRELADGLRALARRQRDARHTSADLESSFARRLNDNTYKIDMKMQELLDIQKRYMDSCQRVQLDDPNEVTDVLDKLIDTLFNKTKSTFQELQNIQLTIKNHDTKVQKLLSSGRSIVQSDPTCRRLENVIRNTTRTSFKENELAQLTEKLVDLTNRADTALQRLETRLKDEGCNVTAAADQLLFKLNGIQGEHEGSDDEYEWEDDDPEDHFYEDGGGGDIIDDNKKILSKGLKKGIEGPTVQPLPRRHLHKQPYDRGPSWKN